MSNNQAALSNAKAASSNSDADQLSASKAFYNHVRSNFLRQSARYLRAGIAKGKTVPFPNHRNLVHTGIQEG